jgi:hypothetical protein
MADTEVPEYCAQTGRLRIPKDGVTMREWFPPNSWIAIASVAGARNWGTRPGFDLASRVAGEPNIAAAHRVVVASVWVPQPEQLVPLPTETTADGTWFASERVVVTRGRGCQLARCHQPFFCNPIAAPTSSTTTVNGKRPSDFRREGRCHFRTLSLTARRPSASSAGAP